MGNQIKKEIYNELVTQRKHLEEEISKLQAYKNYAKECYLKYDSLASQQQHKFYVYRLNNFKVLRRFFRHLKNNKLDFTIENIERKFKDYDLSLLLNIIKKDLKTNKYTIENLKEAFTDIDTISSSHLIRDILQRSFDSLEEFSLSNIVDMLASSNKEFAIARGNLLSAKQKLNTLNQSINDYLSKLLASKLTKCIFSIFKPGHLTGQFEQQNESNNDVVAEQFKFSR